MSSPRPIGTLASFLAHLAGVMRWRVALAIALILLTSVLEGLGVLLLLPLLEALGIDAGEASAARLFSALPALLGEDGRPRLLPLLALVAAAAVVQAALTRWQTRVAYSLEHEFVARERDRMYRAVTGTSWAFFVRQRASDFTHALTSELQRVGVATYLILSLATSACLTLVYVAVAVRLSPMMSLLASGAALIPLVLTWSRLGSSQRGGDRVAAANGAVYAAAIEHLAATKTTKSYGAEHRNAALFAALSADVARANADVIDAHTNQRAFVQLSSTLGLAALLYLASRALALPGADILVLVFVFARLMPRLSALHSGLQGLLVLLPSWTETERLRKTCESAAETTLETDARFDLVSQVAFDHVGYRYEGVARRAVDGVSLAIAAGSITGLAGPSGGGKSTLADLLLGLLQPESGRILVDGRPLAPELYASWREQIGYVAQDTFLFHDTVRANLRWARPDASDADIRLALDRASASAFVAALPEGLDTVLGDRGVRLSGGERQRLALARALLRQPRLLVLDEATSALDSENEQAILQSIAKLRGSMTILVITHRLTTLRDADVIHVMDQGRLVESGRWGDLLSHRESRLARLAQAQGLD